MNETPIKTPTLAELRDAGYSIDVRHVRLFDTAYVDKGKVIVETLEGSLPETRGHTFGTALRAKGGKTEVWITDKETSAEFYGFARCHPDDNYDKKAGVNEALKRVAALMLVMDGKEGFKCRLQL
jgi:hypothetical protein